MKSTLIWLLLVYAIGNDASGSSLEIQAESSVFDPLTNRIDFTISFNRSPNLLTADEFGRQADAFQYWVFYDNKPFQAPAYPELSAVIRGGEIYVHGNLPIRNSHPPAVGDPYCGGWGGVRAEMPFTIVGTTLSFSVDLATLGDDDGAFAYRLDTYEYGSTSQTVIGGTAGPYRLIPEPATLQLAIAGSLMLALARSLQGARRHTTP